MLLLLLSACVATIDTGVKHVLLLLWLLLLQAAEACTAFGDQKAHAQGTKPKRARRSADDEPGMLHGCTMQRDQQRLALALGLVRLCALDHFCYARSARATLTKGEKLDEIDETLLFSESVVSALVTS